MKRLSIAFMILVAVFTCRAAFPLGEGGIQGSGSGTTNASYLSSGTIPAARIGDNSVTSTKLLDNTVASGKIADGTIVAADIADNVVTDAKILDASLDLAGSKFTGLLPKANGGWGASIASADGIPTWATGTITWNSWAAFLLQIGIIYNPADNTWIFPAAITATEYVSTALDNSRGVTVPNTADPTGADLAAGKIWVTDNCVRVRNSDNTVTFSAGCLTKSFSFGIDNVVDGDDIFVWMDLPRAITITKVTCFASTDNVIGVLSECTAADLTSCTDVDDTDFTIGGETAQTAATSFDSGFENAGIAAGAHLKWVTTSEGTTNSNKLSCSVQYRE